MVLLVLMHHHHVLLLVDHLLVLYEFRVYHLIGRHHDHLLWIHWSKHHLLLVWDLMLLHLHWISSIILWDHHALVIGQVWWDELIV